MQHLHKHHKMLKQKIIPFYPESSGHNLTLSESFFSFSSQLLRLRSCPSQKLNMGLLKTEIPTGAILVSKLDL